MVPYLPLPWTNQRLPLYHGTLDVFVQSILGGIQLTHSRPHADFGRGFYLTTAEPQATSWAWQLSLRRPGTLPAVIRFDVDRDRLVTLETLFFVRGAYDADDFWGLVFHCRSGAMDHGRSGSRRWYDVVVGPVAASWRQRLSIQDTDQVSFHTDRAVGLLNQSNPGRTR